MFQNLVSHFAKFAIAGGVGTTVHYLTLMLLVFWLGIPAGRAAIAGAIAGASVVYLLNYRYTFENQGSHLVTFPRFAVIALVGAALNGALVGILDAAGMYFLLAQAITTVIILIINFIVSKIWVFR